mmetsp:Transcript_46513/g.145833  ORF Transcript_46513/g.145833 Transcript_46513/m.145833 type:complete len:137 (+) Transcript_46513:334-744(+)
MSSHPVGIVGRRSRVFGNIAAMGEVVWRIWRIPCPCAIIRSLWLLRMDRVDETVRPVGYLLFRTPSFKRWHTANIVAAAGVDEVASGPLEVVITPQSTKSHVTIAYLGSHWTLWFSSPSAHEDVDPDVDKVRQGPQ